MVKRNLVIIGAGHSGTRYITQLLSDNGWNPGYVDEHWEHPNIVLLNKAALDGRFDTGDAQATLEFLDKPYIIKDPRFVDTLNLWADLFKSNMLVLIERSEIAILMSHYKRSEWVSIEDVRHGLLKARLQFEMFRGLKTKVDYSSLLRNDTRSMIIEHIKRLAVIKALP